MKETASNNTKRQKKVFFVFHLDRREKKTRPEFVKSRTWSQKQFEMSFMLRFFPLIYINRSLEINIYLSPLRMPFSPRHGCENPNLRSDEAINNKHALRECFLGLMSAEKRLKQAKFMQWVGSNINSICSRTEIESQSLSVMKTSNQNRCRTLQATTEDSSIKK